MIMLILLIAVVAVNAAVITDNDSGDDKNNFAVHVDCSFYSQYC